MNVKLAVSLIVAVALGCSCASQPHSGAKSPLQKKPIRILDIPYDFDIVLEPGEPGHVVTAKLTLEGPVLIPPASATKPVVTEDAPEGKDVKFRLVEYDQTFLSHSFVIDFEIALKKGETIDLLLAVGRLSETKPEFPIPLKLQIPGFLGIGWKDAKDVFGNVVEFELPIK